MSDASMAENPAIAKSWAGRQIEFPENAKSVISVKPMSMFRKMISNNPYGYTSPLGQISINNDQILADNQNLDDVMAHEMKHANQGIGGFLRQTFGSREPENSAINTEALRKVRNTDIALPNTTGQVDPRIAQVGNPLRKQYGAMR